MNYATKTHRRVTNSHGRQIRRLPRSFCDSAYGSSKDPGWECNKPTTSDEAVPVIDLTVVWRRLPSDIPQILTRKLLFMARRWQEGSVNVSLGGYE